MRSCGIRSLQSTGTYTTDAIAAWVLVVSIVLFSMFMGVKKAMHWEDDQDRSSKSKKSGQSPPQKREISMSKTGPTYQLLH